MSAFGIWAIILTGIYLIYYPVIICLDLFGKKGQKKDGVEEFDTGVGDGAAVEEEETPTTVYETDEGYRVGDGGEGVGPHDLDEEPAPQTVPDPAPLTPEQAKEEEYKKMKERIDDSLKGGQVIHPEYQQTVVGADAFLMTMSQPLGGKSRIKHHVLY